MYNARSFSIISERSMVKWFHLVRSIALSLSRRNRFFITSRPKRRNSPRLVVVEEEDCGNKAGCLVYFHHLHIHRPQVHRAEGRHSCSASGGMLPLFFELNLGLIVLDLQLIMVGFFQCGPSMFWIPWWICRSTCPRGRSPGKAITFLSTR